MNENRYADELRIALEGPVLNTTLRKNVGEGKLDYEVYLKTQTLLGLQTEYEALSVPDELLFQVVHQSQELWMKQIGVDSVELVRALDADKLSPALAQLHRMFLIARSLNDQMRILQTMPPDVFQVVRRQLGNGSGLESPGYTRFGLAGKAVWEAFERWCARREMRPIDIYLEPQRSPESHRLAEAMLDLDESIQMWLVGHYMLVRRTIGVAKSVKALDGFPTVLLATRMTRPLFPVLWDIRVEMTETWNREGGYAPGAEREVAKTAPVEGDPRPTKNHTVSGTRPAVIESEAHPGMGEASGE